MRTYRTFSWRDAALRIASDRFDEATACIRRQRAVLEDYIGRYPEFGSSLAPVPPVGQAPEVALRMHRAAYAVGVGPMAAVAGTMAQMAAEAALEAGAREAIVENGGDICMMSDQSVIVALHCGSPRFGDQLAFSIDADDLPLACCSSSSTMGHSMSLGVCDLATVFSTDASLADAAATQACNLVQGDDDLQPACQRIADIAGVRGVLLIKSDRAAMAGRLPPLIRHTDPGSRAKITRSDGLASPL